MRKLFSLFAAMLMALAVSAQTDFAAPGYKCAADDAVLSGAPTSKVGLIEDANGNYIGWSDVGLSSYGDAKATWTITATRGCYVSVSLELSIVYPAGKSNAHIFQVKIKDAKGNEKGTLVESAENADADKTKVLDGTILIPTAGTYTVELQNRRDYGKGGVKNVILTYAADAPSEIIDVTSVELNKSELALQVDEVEQLSATVLPDNATDPSVTWTSSDDAVATVSEDGFVTAVSVGTANITAKAGEISATCAVTVSAVAVPDVNFAEPYVLSAKKAELEGKIWKMYTSDTYKLYGEGGHNKQYGNASWTINVTHPCIVSGVLNAVEGGHLFVLDLYKGEDKIGYIAHPKAKAWSKNEIALDSVDHSTLTFPEAGEYTLILRNEQEWSSGKVAGVTLTFESELPQTLYLKPGIWYYSENQEKFAIYSWADGKDAAWSDFMTLAENETDIWTGTIPGDHDHLIFVRFGNASTTPSWTDNMWNKTFDLEIQEGKDMYSITAWGDGEGAPCPGTWSKYEYVVPAKFYITGDAALVGDVELAWKPNAIKSTEDTYTLNLAAGSYRMKVTVDGTWATGKGIDDLTTRADGLQDINGNIGFILEEAGQVQVTYTNSEFKLEGNFSNTPIYKTYMATGGGWAGDDESSAVWNNEAKTITVNLVKSKQVQWQAQVWYKDIVAKADKLYDINLKLTSTKAMSGVIVKWQDANNIFVEEGISLEADVPYSLSKLNQAGKAGGDGMLIFDFGYAAEGTVVTISEISIVEKDIPEPEPVVGCDWENLSWVGSALAPKYVNQFKVCVGENAPNIDVFQHPGWASEEGLYMTFPSAVWDKSKFSISADQYDLQGAGMIIHASVFELNYTEVTINCDNKDFTFTVYNANGPEAVYTVVGSSEVAFGTSWDLNNADNKMVLADGLYKWEKTELSLAAGEITFKVAKNHAWDEAWPASDYVLNIPSEGLYTISITFNESTKEVNATVTKTGEAVVLPTIKLHGNFDGEWKDTDPFVEAGDKKSASLTMTLDKGKYAFGLKKDGNWYANGSEFTRENPSAVIESNTNVDMSLDVDKDGAYTFTWTFETNTLDVDYPGCHWNELAWLGTTDATYANQFKVCVGDPTPNVVNIQKPGFASEIGIYLEFPSAVWDKSKFSLPESKYAIQGAGMVIYLSAFSAKETEVTIGCNNNDFIFTVYNAKGTDTPTSIDNTVVETKAVKYIQNGQLFIEMDGKVYNIVGARVK